MGALGANFKFLGANCGSVGATPGFRFAICCFAHIGPVSGFSLGWGVSSTEALKPERRGNLGRVWAMQNRRQYLMLANKLISSQITTTAITIPIEHPGLELEWLDLEDSFEGLLIISLKT